MDSGMIGKIEKSKRYAEEPERIRFDSFDVTLRGTNSQHSVSYQTGSWKCTCNYFAGHDVCSHTMAMERILGVMLPPAAIAQAEPAHAIA